ncbi:hypothetical protein SAMN05444161_8464 [Rhizobiales bacterium GAS191]|nr:hypothetical protein SAMN05444161_8464 [Rhizobiales bacterium GAS191]
MAGCKSPGRLIETDTSRDQSGDGNEGGHDSDSPAGKRPRPTASGRFLFADNVSTRSDGTSSVIRSTKTNLVSKFLCLDRK